jgi:predicted NBD/HSP70 family sugar kinase
VTAEDVARAASAGDPVAVAMLQGAGRRVGAMLASVVNFFNPSLIVLGGGVSNSPDVLLASIRETVYRRSLPLATRELLIQRSSLGGLAGVIGAVDGRRRAVLARGIGCGAAANRRTARGRSAAKLEPRDGSARGSGATAIASATVDSRSRGRTKIVTRRS